jgi:hypothetical protein
MAFRWLKDNVGGAKAPKEKYSLEMLQCVQCRLCGCCRGVGVAVLRAGRDIVVVFGVGRGREHLRQNLTA